MSSFKLCYLCYLLFNVLLCELRDAVVKYCLGIIYVNDGIILLPIVKASPAQQYSVRQANSPRADVQFRDHIEPIDLRTVHKILIQADAKQIAAALRVAQFHR